MAEGARIAVLDVESPTPVTALAAIQRFEVPHATATALSFYEDPATGDRALFIAGGTLGLWQLELCPTLFDPVPSECGADPSLLEVDRVGNAGTFVWKRCVDVGVIPECPVASDRTLVLALYDVSSDPTVSSVGRSELRAYAYNDLLTPPTFLASVEFLAPDQNDPNYPHHYRGTALDTDPGDPTRLFVALGEQWLWRVDLQASPQGLQLVPTRIAAPGIAICGLPSPATCPYGESMRDIAVVRDAAGDAWVYAAMAYGRLLEYRLSTGAVIERQPLCGDPQGPCGYPERVDAILDDFDRILVTIGLHANAPLSAETRAPDRPTGIWRTPCLDSSIGDPNDPHLNGENSIRIYSRGPTYSLAEVMDTLPYASYWGSLLLRDDPGWGFRLIASVEHRGFELYEIAECGGDLPGPMGPIEPVPCFVPELMATYAGPVFPCADGHISLVNPDLTYFGHDAAGPYYPREGLQVYVESGAPVDLKPVPHTVSVCAGESVQQSFVDCPDPYPGEEKRGDPNPHIGAIFGGASLIDPADADREVFFAGSDTWRRCEDDCDPLPDCLGDPCPPGPAYYKRALLANADNYVGCKVVSMYPGFGPTGVPSGLNLDMEWSQVASPTRHQDQRTDSVPYAHTALDPREWSSGTYTGLPYLLYYVRSAAEYGFKALIPGQLMDYAGQTCSGQNEIPGKGEDLATVGPVWFAEALTHVEFERLTQPGPSLCNLLLEPDFCAVADNGNRSIFNNKVDVFWVTESNGTPHLIAAIAVGFVAAADVDGQFSTCVWDTYFGQSMLVLYDITNLYTQAGSTHPPGPQLRRVALGPKPGHAFAVRAKTYGSGPSAKTYAFVADTLGRLLVFDVSGDILFASTPTVPYLPGTPLLVPETHLEFPEDPRDGHRPNCVDVELDQKEAYCALARAGVAVVDISIIVPNQAPPIYTILDTPGLAQGVFFRTNGNGEREMFVGDSRGGARLYARAAGKTLGMEEE